MSELHETVADVGKHWYITHMERELEEAKKNIVSLAARYDEAIQRINDLTAELEYLRREVSR